MKLYKISQEDEEDDEVEVDSAVSLAGYNPNQSDRQTAPVDWHRKDMYGVVWSEESVRKFLGLPDAVVYRALIELSDLNEILVEEEDNDPSAYDWSEFGRRATNPPPIVVTRKKDNTFDVNEGNHRVRFWRESGYTKVPAWVNDELIAEHIRKNKVEEYRIIQ